MLLRSYGSWVPVWPNKNVDNWGLRIEMGSKKFCAGMWETE